MKTIGLYQRLSELGKSTRDKQTEISVAEVWHLHEHISLRYEVLETTNVLRSFIKSKDLKLTVAKGSKVLQEQIKDLEKLIKEYGINIPARPPFDSKSISRIEVINDRYIFRRIFRGIQSFIEHHTAAFIHSTSPKLREQYRKFLFKELELYDMYMEYGKQKGFLLVPPMYRE